MVLLVASGPSSDKLFSLPCSTAAIDDTNELCGVEESLLLFASDVELGYLLLLLAELSLESISSPIGLAGKKGGHGGGPKENCPVSSKSDSRLLICLWKSLFNHSTPLGLSKWMPLEDDPPSG